MHNSLETLFRNNIRNRGHWKEVNVTQLIWRAIGWEYGVHRYIISIGKHVNVCLSGKCRTRCAILHSTCDYYNRFLIGVWVSIWKHITYYKFGISKCNITVCHCSAKRKCYSRKI